MVNSDDHFSKTDNPQEQTSEPPALVFGSAIASTGLATMILQSNMNTDGLIYMLLAVVLSTALALIAGKTRYAGQIVQWCTDFCERRKSGSLLLGVSAAMILVSAAFFAAGLIDAGYAAFGACLVLQGIWITGTLQKHGWSQPQD